MDFDATNGAGLRQADEAPGGAGVDRLPHASSRRGVASDIRRACADVDDVGVGVGDVDRADGAAEEAVADVAPRRAGVIGLPHTAAGGAHEEGVGLGGESGDGRRTTTPEGAE
jgi:hypothetical protein